MEQSEIIRDMKNLKNQEHNEYITSNLAELALQKPINTREIDFTSEESIISRIKYKPDIIHLHNIHSDYFDLRVLKSWYKQY